MSLNISPAYSLDLTLTDTKNNVTVGSVGDGLLLSLQAVMKGNAGAQGVDGSSYIVSQLGEWTYTYQSDYLLSKVKDAQNKVLYTYDVGGNLIQRNELQNNTRYTTTYTYSVGGDVTNKLVVSPSVNTSSSGTVTITGSAVIGQTLTASNNLTDADGMGAVSYQWYSDNVIISGATSATYTIVVGDIGKVIKVIASYTDFYGTAESVSSANTDTVVDAAIFTPADLFTDGSEGIWFDVSDFGRYMGELGSELFSTSTPVSFINTGTAVCTWSSSTNTFTVSSTGTAQVRARLNLGLTVGKSYLISFSFTGSFTYVLHFDTSNVITANQNYSGVIVALSDSIWISNPGGSNGGLTAGSQLVINSLSIKELTAISTATLYQDAAGTIPVTAVEQPVGLMLDKSKGLVLGSELITNGDFGLTTGWSLASGAAITSNKLLISSVAANTIAAEQAGLSLSVGKNYQLKFTVSNYVSGSLNLRLGNNTLNNLSGISSNGNKTYLVTPNNVGTQSFSIFNTGTPFIGDIDNISVRELHGNHATQSTSTARPVLKSRYNLLLNSATLSTQSVTTIATDYTLKFSGSGSITLSGTKTGSYAAGTHTLTGVTAGTLTLTVSGSVTDAQLTTTQNAHLPYQWITTATSYDSDPAKFPPYLYFDGVDDYMTLGDVLDLRLTSMTMCVAANIERSESTVLAKTLYANTVNRYALLCTNLNGLNSFYVPEFNVNIYSPVQNLTFKTNVLTSVIDRAGSVSLQIDNATKLTTTYTSDASVDVNTSYRFLIGAYNNATDTGIELPMKGPIYQIVVVNRVITTQETTNTKSYLAAKAGVTI